MRWPHALLILAAGTIAAGILPFSGNGPSGGATCGSNAWTNRIAGCNVPGGSANIVNSDSLSSLTIPNCPGASPSTPCSGYGAGVQYYFEVYDNTISEDAGNALDAGPTLKLTINPNYFQGEPGWLDWNFCKAGSVGNASCNFGAGQEFYIQWRTSVDALKLNPANNSGAQGMKHAIVTEGDSASVFAGDCSNSPSEVVPIIDVGGNANWLYPFMYTNCAYSAGTKYFTSATYQPIQLPGAPSLNFLDQPATGCPHYTGRGLSIIQPPCFLYTANEFFTLQLHIKVGTFNTGTDTVMELWAAHPGQPAILISQAVDAQLVNDGTGGATGKYGKISLSAYDTGGTYVGASPTAVWYSSVIVSKRRIPDPDTATPNAPDSLSLSAISSSSVTVNWRVNSQNGTAQDDTGFLIERCTDTQINCLVSQTNGSPLFSQIATTAAGVSSYVDSTVSAGHTYTYRVRAKNAAGNSGYSTAICFNSTGTCGGTAAL